MLVVECIEVSALTLVWELRRIADHVSVGMVPPVVVVPLNSLFVVYRMNKHVVLAAVLLELRQSLNVFGLVVKASGQHQGLIGVLFAV